MISCQHFGHSAIARNARRFIRFGIVGFSGVLVDMAVLFLLADPRMLALNLSLGKMLAAETAILSNFVWNDLWTFGDLACAQANRCARLVRFAKFNLVCTAGIGLNVLLLNIQVHLLGWNIYAANFVAIFLVSIWNFLINLKFSWRGALINPPPVKVVGTLHQSP